MKYYYLDDNDDVHGPIELDAIRAAVMAGRLKDDVKVTLEGEETWVRLNLMPKDAKPKAKGGGNSHQSANGSGSPLKSVGLGLIFIGGLAALYFTLVFDPSVAVEGAPRVNNIGKLNTQTHAVLLSVGASTLD